MKRISKLTALLLAIALVLCAFAGAWADETEKKEAITREEYEAVLAAAMANFSKLAPEEQYKFLLSLNGDDELIESYLALLSEEQMTLLSAYIAEVEGYEVPKTVVFTKAGPFLPAVNVGRARMLRAAANGAEDPTADNGLILEKTAADNGDGTYTILLEAYTTGEVISTTKTIPVDIVLVLDQSGSMAFDFEGKSTNINTDRRQYAMKQAVKNFISSVAEKYSNEADHRISIVTFGSSASTLQGWTYVNDSEKTTLQNSINGLPNSPSGATNVKAGMSQAETLMGSGYSYTGKNTKRQKVVVVFTDGVPTTNTDFDTTVATGAISSAKNLKDDGATVYTVGIFNGANPNELYGASGFDTNSNGTIGSQWIKDTWGLFPGTDFPEADRPAGNRFLNYLSSNFPEAESIGLTRETQGWGILHYKITYKITNNFTRSASNYYLTANDSSSLNTIFKTIADNIQTANIDLGSETVIRDIVSESFEIPESTNEIIFYTAAAKADGSFDTPIQITDGSVTAEKTGEAGSQKVDVKGFDFNANFVSESQKSDGTYGKKLIIEFVVKPRNGFLGGNDVPTNGAASGVYADSNAETAVEYFDEPAVDVPVKTITPDVQDQNIYLTNAASLTELVKDMGKFTVDDTSYTVDGTNNAYVNITYTIKDASGNVIATYTIPAGTNASGLAGIVWKDANGNEISSGSAVLNPSDLTNDTVYTITCTVAPLPKAEGEGAGVSSAEGSGTATVNVFKPEITFQDSVEDYLSTHTFPDYYTDTTPTGGNNYVSTVWKHNDTSSSAEGIVIKGEEPTLNLTYTVAGTDIKMETDEETGTIIAMQDIPVNLTVAVNKANPSVQGSTSWDITANTTFVHEECDLEFDSTCTWDPNWTSHAGNATKPEPESSESIPEFLIHVKNIVADLTIKKTGLDVYAYKDSDGKVTDEDRESAIITVKATGKDGSEVIYRFALANNQSVTIKDLKVGSTYTVAEENGWTWRYQNYGGYNGTIVMNPNNAPNTNKVTINNTANNPYWLGGDNYAVNVFGTASAGTGH